ncbi:hypothetical protein M8C21_029776, partial [Ambrosia artemisiifolia]
QSVLGAGGASKRVYIFEQAGQGKQEESIQIDIECNDATLFGTGLIERLRERTTTYTSRKQTEFYKVVFVSLIDKHSFDLQRIVVQAACSKSMREAEWR